MFHQIFLISSEVGVASRLATDTTLQSKLLLLMKNGHVHEKAALLCERMRAPLAGVWLVLDVLMEVNL